MKLIIIKMVKFTKIVFSIKLYFYNLGIKFKYVQYGITRNKVFTSTNMCNNRKQTMFFYNNLLKLRYS